MYYPHGRCGRCGERVFAHVAGGYRCPNCAERFPLEESDSDDGAGTELAQT